MKKYVKLKIDNRDMLRKKIDVKAMKQKQQSQLQNSQNQSVLSAQFSMEGSDMIEQDNQAKDYITVQGWSMGGTLECEACK
jgi:hypothetical protein